VLLQGLEMASVARKAELMQGFLNDENSVKT